MLMKMFYKLQKHGKTVYSVCTELMTPLICPQTLKNLKFCNMEYNEILIVKWDNTSYQLKFSANDVRSEEYK